MAQPAHDSSRPAGLPDAEIAATVLAHAPDGVLVSTPSGEIVWANPRLEEMLGHEPGALVGRTVEELVPESVRPAHRAQRETYVDRPRVRAMGPGLDLRAVRCDGTELPVEIGLSPIQMQNRPFVVAIVRDISSRREAESALNEARAALVLSDERQRIARDLHDTVIQRIFATGLSLQGMAATSKSHELAAELEAVVEDLDATIRQIRNSIFSLERGNESDGVRAAVLDAADAATRPLGFRPTVVIEGPVDAVTAPQVGAALVATLREALSNVARHARATSVDVLVHADGRELRLEVVDNGVGIGDERSSGSGIANMAARATEFGGTCRIIGRSEGGTEVEWTVPHRDE